MAGLCLPAFASAGAVIGDSNCAANVLPGNDDGYSAEITLPFTVDFYGRSYNSLWVNNNGNVTFNEGLYEYTPYDLTASSVPIIAPFFADVDTRGDGSGLVTFGDTTYAGRPAFCVDWPEVGYFSEHTDKLNNFQLLLVNRSDTGTGNFDIIFNYNRIRWETGDASGGSGGFGGTSAAVGFANGNNIGSFSQPGSLQNGAFLDSSASGLIHHDRGSSVLGRYVYSVRPSNHHAGQSPCYAAFPSAHTYHLGQTFWWNRQESARQVICYHFGLTPSADFPISASMVCGILAQAIGGGWQKLGTFTDGTCSGTELASDPSEPAKYVGIACSWASDILGDLAKPAGVLASLGCTFAPSAGTSLGSIIESAHELAIAENVIQRGKCVKYSPRHFPSPWLSVDCAANDPGYSTL